MEQKVADFFTNIETSRLLLRKITVDDLDDIFEYASQEIVSRYVPWEVHRRRNMKVTD